MRVFSLLLGLGLMWVVPVAQGETPSRFATQMMIQRQGVEMEFGERTKRHVVDKEAWEKGPLSKAMKEALILEAQADIKYYEAKFRGAELLVSMQTVETAFLGTTLVRTEKLYHTNAVSLEEYERAQKDYEQGKLLVALLKVYVTQITADLDGAKARLLQAEAAT